MASKAPVEVGWQVISLNLKLSGMNSKAFWTGDLREEKWKMESVKCKMQIANCKMKKAK
jgi:hypothetical protein